MKKSQFASVHGGLLARKGQAAPAIPSPIPQLVYTDAPSSPAPDDHSEGPGSGRRDVKRWSNQPLMASKESVRSRPLPPSGKDSPSDWLRCDANCAADSDQSGELAENDYGDPSSRFKISVRLTAEQRRRMRTIAAQLDWPHQKILSKALDAYLDRICKREMKGCACLNRRLGAD